MKKNVGGTDKLLRSVAGAALVAWFAFASGPDWALIGVVLLATGLFNFCPIYALFGISSNKAK